MGDEKQRAQSCHQRGIVMSDFGAIGRPSMWEIASGSFNISSINRRNKATAMFSPPHNFDSIEIAFSIPNRFDFFPVLLLESRPWVIRMRAMPFGTGYSSVSRTSGKSLDGMNRLDGNMGKKLWI